MSIMNESQLAEFKEIILSTLYKNHSPSYLQSREGQEEIEDIISNRHNVSEQFVIPWVANFIDLSSSKVVEIGCGAGSSSVSFAKYSNFLYGYDIDKMALKVAEARLRLSSLSNAQFSEVSPDTLWSQVKQDHPDGCDVVLFYALLEHLTIQERIESIRCAWDLLRDQGLFIVLDTPNRLAYMDLHTSLLPFFHFLPPELAIQYYPYSPRDNFVFGLRQSQQSNEDIKLRLTRWGTGVSYHEFELGLPGDWRNTIIADGFEKEITDWIGFLLEDKILIHYFLEKGLDIPLAFARRTLNIIFRKNAATPYPVAIRHPRDHIQGQIEIHQLDPRIMDYFFPPPEGPLETTIPTPPVLETGTHPIPEGSICPPVPLTTKIKALFSKAAKFLRKMVR